MAVQQAVACASSLPSTSTTTPLAAHFVRGGGGDRDQHQKISRSVQEATAGNNAAAAEKGKEITKKKKPFYLVTGPAKVHPVVIEAVARLRGVNKQKHVLLRGATAAHGEEDYIHIHNQEDKAAASDHLFHQAAPTPECHTASMTAAKLYTEGNIPNYFLNMTTTTSTTTNELITTTTITSFPATKEEQQEEASATDQLCTQSQGVGQVLVCINRQPTDGTLTGTITNTGAVSLCNAAIRVLAPLPSHDGKESKADHLSPELALLGPKDAALHPGETARFDMDFLQSTHLVEEDGDSNNGISGLTVEPDFESCVGMGGERRGLLLEGDERNEGVFFQEGVEVGRGAISIESKKQTVTLSKVMSDTQLQEAAERVKKAAPAAVVAKRDEVKGEDHQHHNRHSKRAAAAHPPWQLKEERPVTVLMLDSKVEAHPFIKTAYWKREKREAQQ